MKKKDLRKKEIKRRKNFFPTLLVTFLAWALVAMIVYFVDPNTFGAIPVFFITTFIALLFTFSVIFANTRRGSLAAASIIIFLFLRHIEIGNFINFLLIGGVAISIDLYFSKK